MRTTTILSAWEATAEFLRNNDPYPSNPKPGQFYAARRRQVATFRAALLARLEAGDRAREALEDIRKNAGFNYDYEDIIACTKRGLKP